jgi:hypothetical protein
MQEERMTAIVLPNIDRSTIEELRRRIPSLAEIELPSMEMAGRKADETIDRMRGRSRAPGWPWIAAGVFLVALVVTLAAFFTWNRRAGWSKGTEPWADDTDLRGSMASDDGAPDLQATTATDPIMGGGLTAAESSLTSTGGMPDETA